MGYLERKLAPTPIRQPWKVDLAGLALLALLGALMLPAWRPSFMNFQAQLASTLLLPALGLVFALRCGAIDLSVWAVMALGGVVAAVLIAGGFSPATAFALAIAGGAVLGALAGGLTALRVPSLVATLATGLGAMAIAWWIAGDDVGRAVVIPEYSFEPWKEAVHAAATGGQEDELVREPVVLLTRMLFVAGCFALSMLVLLLADNRLSAPGASQPGERTRLVISLAASGALSAAGGCAWLIDNGRAPLPQQLVGDLRIPAAAVLCGALLFAGRGRTLLCGVWLPGAMLVAIMWRQQTWYLSAGIYELQLAVLTLEVLVAQWAMRRMFRREGRGRMPARVTAAVAIGALVLFALSAYSLGPVTRRSLQYVSLVSGSLAAAALVGLTFVDRRRRGDTTVTFRREQHFDNP